MIMEENLLNHYMALSLMTDKSNKCGVMMILNFNKNHYLKMNNFIQLMIVFKIYS